MSNLRIRARKVLRLGNYREAVESYWPHSKFQKSGDWGGRKRKSPCAVTGQCSDCRTTDKICNILTIIEGKPARTDLTVVMVNADMGLGFDPAWPKDRITTILNNYKKFVWVPPQIDRW